MLTNLQVEGLEQVLEQNANEVSRGLDSLVSIIVLRMSPLFHAIPCRIECSCRMCPRGRDESYKRGIPPCPRNCTGTRERDRGRASLEPHAPLPRTSRRYRPRYLWSALLGPLALSQANLHAHPFECLQLSVHFLPVGLLQRQIEECDEIGFVGDLLHCPRTEEHTIATISWSVSMPRALKAIQMGMSTANALCFKYTRPFFTTT